jgi:16S rRNA (guanine527-N7)-methyltransferase
LFAKWNASINLSAARTPAEIDEQIADSLAIVPLLRGAARVLDVGSGGGFPVVLAAAELPEVAFVSLEPVHKKHAFLRTAARELGLENLEPLALRLEAHAGRDYDVAMSRATFDLREWLALGTPFVRAGGGVVIGFEAVRRDDLQEGVERFPYGDGGKSRAFVRLIRK